MTELLSPAEWRRVGPGRRRDFPGLRAGQIAEVLAALPKDLGPYQLIMHELVPGEGRHVSVARPVDPVLLGDLVEEGHWKYFIVSESLSPEIIARLPHVDSATFSLNGAINLQIGARNRLGVEPPSLGAVTKVATAGGESRTHDEYGEIYDTAIRVIRKLEQ
jgi:hypothetical protein